MNVAEEAMSSDFCRLTSQQQVIRNYPPKSHKVALPDGSDGKESAYNAEDLGLILSWEYPLKKGMATHSSILVWRIPWTEEPGGLQSMELQSWTWLSY